MNAVLPPPTGTIIFLRTDIEAGTRRWDQHPAATPPARPRPGGPDPRSSAP